MNNCEPIITDWLIALGTLAVVIVAIFQEKIKAIINRPKLKLLVNINPPDCHKTYLERQFLHGDKSVNKIRGDCYFFRFNSKNEGNRRAERVEVFISELQKQQASGEYKKIDSFLPMNLTWSHVGGIFYDAISPKMRRFCDLGYILKPDDRRLFSESDDPNLNVPSNKTIFQFTLETAPYTMSHLIPPGKYRLIIYVASQNTKPIEQKIEINHTGNWYDDERKMFSEGVNIKKI